MFIEDKMMLWVFLCSVSFRTIDQLDKIPVQKDSIFFLGISCSGKRYLYLLSGPDSRTAASFTNSNNYQLKGDQNVLELRIPGEYM